MVYIGADRLCSWGRVSLLGVVYECIERYFQICKSLLKHISSAKNYSQSRDYSKKKRWLEREVDKLRCLRRGKQENQCDKHHDVDYPVAYFL